MISLAQLWLPILLSTVAVFFASSALHMAAPMVQWFVFCLVVSLFAAYIAAVTLAAGTDGKQVFRVVATATFMAYSFGAIPAGIWLGQPWKSVFKHVVDGLVYALVTGALFGWLWPDATAI